MKITFKGCNPSNYQKGRSFSINWICLHFTSNNGDTAQNNADFFARESGLRASAHYFVDPNGVVQSVKDCDTAWHCGRERGGSYYNDCRNANSIGIEMCSVIRNGVYVIPKETMKRAAKLTRELMAKYHIPVSRVCRHYDVTHKQCLPLDSTELLTRDGWKSLSDVKTGEEVMQYDTDTDRLSFGAVSSVVEPYEAELLSCHGFEATANHRMWAANNSHVNEYGFNWREQLWGDMLTGCRLNAVKNGALYSGVGLPLTDDEIRFLVWVQGDGHYMKGTYQDVCGIEFHVKKQRKIDRIKEILDNLMIDYTVSNKKDGSVSYRNYGTDLYHWCEQWLKDKQFQYNLLEMNEHQYDVFWNECLQVDGCEAGDLYTSAIQNNLDVVQAICATKGYRTNKTRLGKSSRAYDYCAVDRLSANYTFGGRKRVVKKRMGMVSCVSVPTGYILVRQNTKTFIVGNCPEPWVRNPQLWQKFKDMLTEKEVEDMTEAQTRAIAKQEISKAESAKKVYNSVAECPAWAKDTVQKLVNKGFLQGDDKGKLALTTDLLRLLVINDRAHLYG